MIGARADRPDLRVLSLGAGVQSSCMALMASRGDIDGPRPDFAIFADTGWEPQHTYDYLAYLEPLLAFPLIRVSAGNLRDDLIARSSARSGRFTNVPFFLQTDTKPGQVRDGIGRRQCTSHYKIEPINRKVRELLGVGPRARVRAGAAETWVGISVDEIMRATPSKIAYSVKRFPLLEARMTRRDCIAWLEARQYRVPPKSACLGCPFHSNAEWRALRSRPEEWADTVAIDRLIRQPIDKAGSPTLRARQYMHPARVPLDEVDLSTPADAGQGDMFNHECEGMCGL